ncbi:ECF-type sigma factor [uncultured Cloacibacillus sp.]|uniref:ECF-type sigma factor n=1 Tax=uncultured Cloacibacillus sp. TaxID=889794 RepID=UPI00320B9B11
MRRHAAYGGGAMTEELEATLGKNEERYEETELRETLERLLTREELDITQALMEGFTQAEIARGLGVTQQAVAARVKKIRAKLRGAFYDERG